MSCRKKDQNDEKAMIFGRVNCEKGIFVLRNFSPYFLGENYLFMSRNLEAIASTDGHEINKDLSTLGNHQN